MFCNMQNIEDEDEALLVQDETLATVRNKRTLTINDGFLAGSAKILRSDTTCSYWLSKRNRHCLTKSVAGETYCQVHLDVIRSSKLSVGGIGLQLRLNESIAPVDVMRPSPTPSRCQFWLARKKRYCKLSVSAEGKFCVEHSVVEEDTPTFRVRMPCPNDPKHSCYADRLEHHLKKCNAKVDEHPVYYEKSINAGEEDNDDVAEDKPSIRAAKEDERLSLINNVCSLHADCVGEIETTELFHHSLLEEINKPENGAVAQKHLKQQASLIGHMGTLGLLRDGVDYVEFGAGRGGLSHWVQIANSANIDTNYILVDRSSCRYKKDSYHKGVNQGPSFQRIRIDIQNLNLAKVPAVKQSNRPMVGIGKHLCGSATDLMLRCLAETADVSSENSSTRRVEGMALALCCHHRCDWRSYVGKRWFLDHGLSAHQFRLIVSMSAWATCSSRTEIDNLSHAAELPASCQQGADYSGTLNAAQREVIGIKCKQLIDAGRVQYLTERGFDSRLVYYVQRSLTLENVALTATRRCHNDSESLTPGTSSNTECRPTESTSVTHRAPFVMK